MWRGIIANDHREVYVAVFIRIASCFRAKQIPLQWLVRIDDTSQDLGEYGGVPGAHCRSRSVEVTALLSATQGAQVRELLRSPRQGQS